MDDSVVAALASFLGAQPFAPPPPVAPPRRWGPPPPAVRIDDGAFPGPAAWLRRALWRAGIDERADGLAVALVEDPSLPAETFRFHVGHDRVSVHASSPAGMTYGATEVRARLAVGAVGEGSAGPALPIRLLAGWGIYRTHRWDDVLEVAVEGRANRVLCNWWTAGADERLGPADRAAVGAARSLGIEPVCELRRQVLGPGVSLTDERAVKRLLDHYDDAVDHGFRSFGLLFDDTDHDPFEDEVALLDRVRQHLAAGLGEEPELLFCPRFYWFPGQADYSWMGGGSSIDRMFGGGSERRVADAAERQERYLRLVADHLGSRTHVYLANWWSAVPDDAGEQTRERFSALIGQAPVFWDNQLQNDFRAAAVHPMASHQRTPAFAGSLAGYCLNAPSPLAPHAAGCVTALRWAWDPSGYDGATAHTDAIVALFGPAAVEVVARLGGLLGELSAPRTGTESHLGGLRREVRAGGAAALRHRLTELATAIAGCAADLDERAPGLARRAVADWWREVDRLRLEVRLAELIPLPDADEARELLFAAVAALLVERLPAAPGLPDLVAQGADADWSGIPGSSWALHFLHGPMRAVRHAYRFRP